MSRLQNSRDSHNITALTITESFWGFQMSLIYTATVLTVLLRHYGASDKVIGLISAIETGTIVLPQVIGLLIFRSMKKRKRHLILWHLIVMAPFLFLMGFLILEENHFSHEFMKVFLLLLFACFNTAIGITLGVWQDWLASVFPKEIRGRAMGISFFFSSAAGFAAALIAGKLINMFPGTKIYGILFIAAGFFANLSILSLVFIKEAQHSHEIENNFNLTRIFA